VGELIKIRSHQDGYLEGIPEIFVRGGRKLRGISGLSDAEVGWGRSNEESTKRKEKTVELS